MKFNQKFWVRLRTRLQFKRKPNYSKPFKKA